MHVHVYLDSILRYLELDQLLIFVSVNTGCFKYNPGHYTLNGILYILENRRHFELFKIVKLARKCINYDVCKWRNRTI